MEISSDLQVIKPIITIVSNTFLSIENYVNIVEFDNNLIRIKTKEKIVKITDIAKYESHLICINDTD